MSTASQTFTSAIENELARLETRLLEAVPASHSSVGDRIADLVKAGGKRLRPSLTLHIARMLQADTEKAISVAAGIELLHTATLVHDDLVDNAQERRGRPTLNSQFPMGLVILSGDLLFAEAAQLVAEADHVGVVRSFARALSEICHGELMQAQTKHTLATLEEYYERIYGKTASLFRTAAETGAMLGTDDDDQIEALAEYGRLLGMAFQIVDDALDFSSNEALLGKPSGHDLREGVISLPVILYHKRHTALNGTFKRVIAGKGTEDQINATIEAIRSSGAVESALEIARDFSRQARQQLTNFPDSMERDILINLTHFAVAREY
jgi:geranylgeranyl pyrophosphate synthase